MFYIFHGEDEFSRSEAIAQLRQKMDPVVGDLNTAILDGYSLSVSDLQAACDVLPFMGDRRLVIVHDLLSSAAGKSSRRKGKPSTSDEGKLRELEAYLPHLPQSTRLILAESCSLPDEHPLLRLARELGGVARQFLLPKKDELQAWIRRRARGKGVEITPAAIALLDTWIGSNLRLLDQELEKLATYVGSEGKIDRPEVERLVSAVQEANIFHMVDALGGRDGRRALRLLRQLLNEGAEPLYLLTMIVRQFRLLLQARELDTKGTPAPLMARQMEVPPFIARKCLQQALNFRPAELRAIMGQLLEIDFGIKTGQLDGSLALDLFVVRWAGR